jgi:hypothetical protein
MSRTRYEWTLCDYAIWTAGAVTVPDLRDVLGRAGAVEPQRQRRRRDRARDRPPTRRSSRACAAAAGARAVCSIDAGGSTSSSPPAARCPSSELAARRAP